MPDIKDNNFKPKIFTDVKMPAKQSYGPNICKGHRKFDFDQEIAILEVAL